MRRLVKSFLKNSAWKTNKELEVMIWPKNKNRLPLLLRAR